MIGFRQTDAAACWQAEMKFAEWMPIDNGRKTLSDEQRPADQAGLRAVQIGPSRCGTLDCSFCSIPFTSFSTTGACRCLVLPTARG
jgi:hypothetical protein